MTQRKGSQFNTQNTLISLVVMVVFFIALIWLVRGIFTILAWLAPVLLIITLIINHKIVLNYGKWVLKLLKENTLMGVGVTLLTIVGFPVVSLLLFGRAMLQRKVQQLEKEYRGAESGQFTEYEVVDEEERLELPPLPEELPTDEISDYEELFD